MSEARAARPPRRREVTVEDIRALAGPATPHFALQIRNRIRRLIEPLAPDHPARVEGERQIPRLEELAQHSGDPRGAGPARRSRVAATETGAERARPRARSCSRPSTPRRARRTRPPVPGYLDLLGRRPRTRPGPTQDLMTTSLVPTIYERWWRPALGRIAKGVTGPGMAEEVRIARLLMGSRRGRRRARPRLRPRQLLARVRPRRRARRASSSGSTPRGRCSSAAPRTSRGRDSSNLALVRGDATAAAVPRRLASTACAASRRCTCSPIRSRPSTRWRACCAPGGRIALMTSVRRQLTLPAAEAALERASGMRLFEPDEIVDALRSAASPTSTSGSPAWSSSSAAGSPGAVEGARSGRLAASAASRRTRSTST